MRGSWGLVRTSLALRAARVVVSWRALLQPKPRELLAVRNKRRATFILQLLQA